MPDAYALRGAAFARQGRYQEAVADYGTALETVKDKASLYLARAAVYVALNQQEKALADRDKAVQLEPNLADAWLARGGSYHQLRHAREGTRRPHRGDPAGAENASGLAGPGERVLPAGTVTGRRCLICRGAGAAARLSGSEAGFRAGEKQVHRRGHSRGTGRCLLRGAPGWTLTGGKPAGHQAETPGTHPSRRATGDRTADARTPGHARPGNRSSAGGGTGPGGASHPGAEA